MNVGLLEREKCKLILFFGLSFNIFSPLYTNTNMLPPCNFISVLLVFILCLKCVTSVTPPAQLEVVLEIRVWEVKRGCRKCVCLRWKARYTAVKGQWLHSLLFLWDFFFFLTTHKTLTNCSLPPRDSLKHVQVQVQAFTIQCFEAAPHLKVNNLTQRLNFSQKVLIKTFKIPLSP